jgi:hypothetical protein
MGMESRSSFCSARLNMLYDAKDAWGNGVHTMISQWQFDDQIIRGRPDINFLSI